MTTMAPPMPYQDDDATALPLPSGYLVRFAMIGLGLSIVFRTAQTQGVVFYAASLVAVLTLSSVLVLPRRLLIYPVLILILTMPDITQADEEVEAFGLILRASAWQLSVLRLSPAIIVLMSVLVATVRLFKLNRDNPYNWIFLYFFAVIPVVSWYFGYPQESAARAITDARVPLMFCSGLVLTTSYFNRYPDSLLATCQAFLALAAGTFVLDTLMLFFNPPEVLASIGYRNLSLDSGKGLILLFVFLAVARLSSGKQLLRNLLVIAVGMYVLTAYQTRQLVLTAILGFMLIAPMLGLKRAVKSFVPLVFFLLLAVPVLIRVAPDVWDIALRRFRIGADPSDLAMIDLGRTGSIINATLLLWERKALLTGLGFGSWFTDAYFPMLNLTVSAFDAESLASGKYYRVHEVTFYLLFKFGLIGVWLYFGAFLRPLRDMWHARKNVMRSPAFRTAAIIIVGVFPTVLSFMWWTGKGLLFSGMFVAACIEWAKAFSRPHGTVEAPAPVAPSSG